MHTLIKNDQKSHSKYDIGIGILRPFLSFLVIISHCYNPRNADGIWKDILFKTEGCYFHNRTFFIISLYLSYNTLVNANISKKNARLERLLIPFFIWPLIYFFANKWIIKIIEVKVHKILKYKDLKYQLLLGHGFVNPFWFQFNLIFIFIGFALIISLFKKKYNFILLLLGITSFLLQYNGKNFLYFDIYPEEIKFSLGRLIEMIPPSVTGFFFASFQVIKLLKKYRYRVIFVCIYIIYFLTNFRIFIDIKGFWNQGLKLFFISICIFINYKN
jgi:fucose 4-O-acetylase-like acetyltransferase